MKEQNRQASLDALELLKQRAELADFEGEPYKAVPEVVFEYFLEHEQTIRAVLTAQDVNEELLEAIKDLQEHWDCDVEDCPDDESIGWRGGEELPTTFGQIRRLKKAIARAEQKGE